MAQQCWDCKHMYFSAEGADPDDLPPFDMACTAGEWKEKITKTHRTGKKVTYLRPIDPFDGRIAFKRAMEIGQECPSFEMKWVVR